MQARLQICNVLMSDSRSCAHDSSRTLVVAAAAEAAAEAAAAAAATARAAVVSAAAACHAPAPRARATCPTGIHGVSEQQRARTPTARSPPQQRAQPDVALQTALAPHLQGDDTRGVWRRPRRRRWWWRWPAHSSSMHIAASCGGIPSRESASCHITHAPGWRGRPWGRWWPVRSSSAMSASCGSIPSRIRVRKHQAAAPGWWWWSWRRPRGRRGRRGWRWWRGCRPLQRHVGRAPQPARAIAADDIVAGSAGVVALRRHHVAAAAHAGQQVGAAQVGREVDCRHRCLGCALLKPAVGPGRRGGQHFLCCSKGMRSSSSSGVWDALGCFQEVRCCARGPPNSSPRSRTCRRLADRPQSSQSST